MPFRLHEQYVDTASGFHVARLRDEMGNEHLVQIAVGHDACPLCGHVAPRDNLATIDPAAMISAVIASLNASSATVERYAAQHGIKVK